MPVSMADGESGMICLLRMSLVRLLSLLLCLTVGVIVRYVVDDVGSGTPVKQANGNDCTARSSWGKRTRAEWSSIAFACSTFSSYFLLPLLCNHMLLPLISN